MGGIRKDYIKGDLVLVEDHTNLSSASPLIGMRGETGSIVFPNMIDAYDRKDRQRLEEKAHNKTRALKKSVLAYLPRQNFETRADLRDLSDMGADRIGGSMVPEVLMCQALNIRTIGICCALDLL